MIRQQDRVEYGTATITYCIIKSGRIKTSELIVDADTITVRAPLNKDKVEIQRIVLDKAGWILKKQKQYREMVPELIKPSFDNNTTLPYFGRNYSTIIKNNEPRNSLEIVDGKFLVQLKSAKLSRKILKKLYENWLMGESKGIFEDKVKKFSKKLE